MEKSKLLSGKKLEPINKKQKIAEKIDSLWKPANNSKYNNKKLVVKLETNGKEKRKIFLKLESGKSNLHSNNYNLISELLKEFFNNTDN